MMKGWQIFVHSVRQVFGNFGGAVRVSAVPYLGMMAAIAFFDLGISTDMNFMDEAAMRAAMESGEFPVGRMIFASFIFALVATVVCGLWIVVGWHRHVLLNEVPTTIPRFNGSRLWAYFRRSIWIGIIMIPAMMLFGFLFSLVAQLVLSAARPTSMAEVESAMTVAVSILIIPLGILLLRLSAALPGAALASQVSVGDAWQATKGEGGTFLTLAILFGLVSVVSGLVGNTFGGSIALSLVWQFAFGWMSVMVGASILTTLYGHYIEKRPLV